MTFVNNWGYVTLNGGGERCLQSFGLGGPKARDHWEDLGVGGWITLRWTLGRQESMGRTGFVCLFANNILHHGVSELESLG
jgi:hypothetical protein